MIEAVNNQPRDIHRFVWEADKTASVRSPALDDFSHAIKTKQTAFYGNSTLFTDFMPTWSDLLIRDGCVFRLGHFPRPGSDLK